MIFSRPLYSSWITDAMQSKMGEFECAMYRRQAEIKQRRSPPPIIAPLVEEPSTVMMGLDMDPELWGNLQYYIDLEKVFGKLPFREFFQARVVCKDWNRLASNEKFLKENARSLIPKPFFCLKHPQGDWQIILTYNEAADEWRQVPMPLPYRKGYRANWIDGFLHISYPENVDTEGTGDSVLGYRKTVTKNVVLNLQTRMQLSLPPPHPNIEDQLHQYDSVYSLVVNENQDTFQMVSGVRSRHDAWQTSIYCSKTNSWKLSMIVPSILFTEYSNACGSICCRDTLYTYITGWSQITLYDLKLGTWSELNLPSHTEYCHLGVWHDTVYAVAPYVPTQYGGPEEYSRLSVHVLRDEERKWEEVARIPAELGRHMFCMIDLNIDVEIESQFQRLFVEKLVEASFCEQYVQITVFLQDYHVLDDENHRFWVPGGWVPRRFCLYNLATGEWKNVNLPFNTDREIKFEEI